MGKPRRLSITPVWFTTLSRNWCIEEERTVVALQYTLSGRFYGITHDLFFIFSDALCLDQNFRRFFYYNHFLTFLQLQERDTKVLRYKWIFNIHEVEYSEEPGHLYHIKYRVVGGTKEDFLTIATTRPETLFADTAIAVHPEVIEPLVSKQWFVTMEPLAEKALSAVTKGQLTILPDRFEKIYNHWLTNIKDWCISRQLWWGHRIPVWYIEGKDCEEHYIVARDEREALEKAKEKYGKSVEIYQDPDVLDTWYSRFSFHCGVFSLIFIGHV